MLGLSSDWVLQVERGPDWLFVRPSTPPDSALAEDGHADNGHADNGRAENWQDGGSLAESVWSVVKQHFTYRVVIECDDLNDLTSGFIAQLVSLRRRLQKHDGTLRLCGLSDGSQDVLRLCRLGELLPHFASRSQAVLAHRPAQPR